MQRTKLDVSFNRTWKEYKRGFGEMGKGRDFWLGESLHYMIITDNKWSILCKSKFSV